jgi:hypothetical protein
MKTKNRKAPTEAQKEAAKERRAAIAKMMNVIKAMPETKRIEIAANFGIRNAEGRELSVYNQCLLIAQNDKVSIVGGFSQWKKLGRSVKKGSRALAIWVPCSKKAEGGESAIVPHGTDPASLDESFFVLGNVFDISQTETEDEKLIREGEEALEAAARPRLPTSEFVDVEGVQVSDAPAVTIWDVEEPAHGQRLLICAPPAPAKEEPKAIEPEIMPTIQEEFELVAA